MHLSYIKTTIMMLAVTVLIATGFTNTAAANTTRIKDIVDIEGVRDNQLVGYGLVVGLNGSGDSLKNSPFTQQSMIAMLGLTPSWLLGAMCHRVSRARR